MLEKPASGGRMGRYAGGVSVHTELFLEARYCGSSAALAGDGQG